MERKEFIEFDHMYPLVHSLIRDISNSKWRPEIVVGITRGGLLPALMISHYFEIPMCSLQINLRDHKELTCSDDVLACKAFGKDQTQQNMLIVDDINDTGATIQWIKNDWGRYDVDGGVWHQTTRFATLVHNLSSSQDVDYYCIEINKAEDDVWMVFPWEDWWDHA